MDVLLRTERMVLRRFTPADTDTLVELDSDPEVTRYINGGLPTPRENYVDEIIPRWMKMYEAGPARGFWAACARPPGGGDGCGEFYGWFHLRPGYYWPDEIETGYRFRRAAWGRGLATEGARAVVGHAFEVGVPKVYAMALLANKASQRVMQKIGMRFECDVQEKRWQGEDKRAVKYSLTREGWESPSRGGDKSPSAG